MGKRGKKVNFLIGLYACMIGMLFIMSPSASAESKILHEGYCGYYENRYFDGYDHFNAENAKFTLYEDGTMVISGNGKMESYNNYDDCCTKYRIEDEMPWYKYCDKITHLIIEDGITAIGDYNFFECKNLETIKWSGNLESVGEGAFGNCISLKEVSLPASVKEWYTGVFWKCTGLKNATLEKGVQFGTPGGFAFGRKMFHGCTSLEYVILPEDLLVLPEGFVSECPNIKEFEIPKTLVSMGSYPASLCPEMVILPETVKYLTWDAFYGCENLKELILPDGLLSINGSIVKGCVNLKSLDIPNTVTELGYGVFMESGVESVHLPDGIGNIREYLFYNCKNLKEIKIPESVKEIGWNSFSGCESLKTVTLPKKLTSILWEAFSGCINLESVEWKPRKKGVFDFYRDCFKNCKKLKEFTIPEKTNILGNMFSGCEKVKVKVLCSSEKITESFLKKQNFPQTATLLVPKGKIKEFKKVTSKFETDTYKIRVREMKK